MNKKILVSVAALVFFIVGIMFTANLGPRGTAVAVKPSEMVELKDGDTYTLTVGYVSKDINGRSYRMLAYNGSIPGPMIQVSQGSEITLNFKNETDMDTTIHSHGVRLDNQYDGVPDVTQPTVRPGGSFTYKVKFPDAGMFWYHPHVREDYQQELGLYGNYLVVPSNKDYWSLVNREVPLFLDDILIENGEIRLSKASANHTLMGRYGNVNLVNGETSYSLSANKGEVIRFYITNSANARPFNFAIKNTKLKLVGADGGAYEKEQFKEAIILGPSERAIVEVLFDKTGIFAMENQTPNRTYALGSITVSEAPDAVFFYAKEFGYLRTHVETVDSIDPFRSYFDRAPDKHLKLAIDPDSTVMGMSRMGSGGHMMPNGQMMGGSMMMSASKDGIEWDDNNQMMNQMSTTKFVTWDIIDQDTTKENMDINWVFKKGEPVKIRIFNDPDGLHPMQHPIHFHGQQFLVLARDGVKEKNMVWKDTVLIPVGQTVDILLNPSNPGMWMAHCHIAEHLEAGMMFGFKVE